MCGIVGIMSAVPGRSQGALDAMTASLRHRGPDSLGYWFDEDRSIALGHTRLAIIDLSASGHQPMMSPSGRYVISFNGEIYNHASLRKRLTDSNSAPAWRGHSDTETLVACFDAWGIRATIDSCLGMFAFAVWDRERRALTLARDRLGEKPLYYARLGSSFLFASELKALIAHPSFARVPDRNAIASFAKFGYIPAPLSIYQGVRKLPPGTIVTTQPHSPSDPTPVPYWSLLDVARRGASTPFRGTDAEAISQLEELLSNAISSQQIADVPLGAFLSGGIDSSLVVALMQARASRPVHTLTIGFADDAYNEATYARAVAQHLGTSHTELVVTPKEAQDVIPLLPVLYDEPFADSSQIPTFLVCRLARKTVTVSLSGDAGDELFGGYNRYLWTRRILRAPAPLRHATARCATALAPSTWNRLWSLASPFLPRPLQLHALGDKLHKLAPILGAGDYASIYAGAVAICHQSETLISERSRAPDIAGLWASLDGLDSSEHRMMAIDAATYLPDDILCKVDRAAMGVSLETRVPFLDHRVVDFAWRLPLHMKIRAGRGKWILRQLLYRHVPKELVERPKMGFGIPVGHWIRGPLRSWAEELLREETLRRDGYFHAAPVRRIWAEHLAGTRNWQNCLWNVLMFQAWSRKWLS